MGGAELAKKHRFKNITDPSLAKEFDDKNSNNISNILNIIGNDGIFSARISLGK